MMVKDADEAKYLRLRFLEKLKAGFGAAGLTAILSESGYSAKAASHIFGLGLPFADAIGDAATIALSVLAFLLASRFSDVKVEEADSKNSLQRSDE